MIKKFLNWFFILSALILILVSIGLCYYSKPASLDDLADESLNTFFTCIENKKSEKACEVENEKAYQALSKADLSGKSEFANKQLQSREDCWSEESCEELNFKRIARNCWATYECETYSCLNKNLWRCNQ
jgi:hypothetical protein